MICPFCGRENSLQAKFCSGCGRPLAPAPAPDTGSAPSPDALPEKLSTLRSSILRGFPRVLVLCAFAAVISGLSLSSGGVLDSLFLGQFGLELFEAKTVSSNILNWLPPLLLPVSILFAALIDWKYRHGRLLAAAIMLRIFLPVFFSICAALAVLASVFQDQLLRLYLPRASEPQAFSLFLQGGLIRLVFVATLNFLCLVLFAQGRVIRATVYPAVCGAVYWLCQLLGLALLHLGGASAVFAGIAAASVALFLCLYPYVIRRLSPLQLFRRTLT